MIRSKRVVAALLSLVLAIAVAGATAEMAQAEAYRATAWGSFNVAPEPAVLGTSVTVTGQLLIFDDFAQSFTGHGDQQVEILFSPSDSLDASTLITTAVTTPAGQFTAEVTPEQSGTWRAHYAGNEEALASTTPGDAVAVTEHAPPKTARTGVARCRIVATSDIDGDKKKDQVGVAITGKATALNRKIIIRVLTAKGRRLQTTGDRVNWYYQPFHAAAPIDGRAGNEIVVGDAVGAHAFQWRVVTYRKGALVTLPPPPRSSLTRPSRWATDSAYSFQLGWWRSVSAKGVVSLTKKDAIRNVSGKGHTGKTTVYRWKSQRWVKHSTKTVRYNNKGAYALGGWHIKGLAKWPKEN